ncbi:PAS domain-containing protein [Fischerella thermalis]|uniref:PAS domain-containing protein n=1 Tax=Fischerella thermalis TaxID=372787 RepID=UPI000C7FBCAE|nr:PAS domain-containing protein [Fischerella thermalis]PLZ26527.1 histidine kinase [Fischerella thermalis WC558]PLZ27764.1 histidine kinase [Fischerella thermalis WC341]PLZ51630.1 histidine kinase [Fischerella thermalis WC442]PLZ59207.1 histidine kinase [Fischerella thermalis WC439]PLZ80622.1 histidine kinase [Fischerella thermalis WC213]
MTNLILVVDDDHCVRKQLHELLKTAGYRVLEASSGEEALAIYTQQRPDMVLLDALMSGMDGFTCCAQLKSLPGGDRTPVLMITGLTDQQSLEKAFAAGAADFITKPIKWPILRQRVQRLLEASHAMQALRQQTEQQILVVELSQQALAGTDITSLMQQAVTFVAQCLEVEYSKAWELLPDNNTLLLRAAVGWQQQLVGKATIQAGNNSQAGYTLNVNEPVIVEDLRTETRFNSSPFFQEQPLISSLSVVIHGKGRAFGVLGAHTTKYRTFSKDEIYFLQATANVLATAIARQQAEEALKESEQRWQLAVRGSNDGIWDWNVKTNEVFFSTRWKEMLGYEEQEISNHLDEWSSRVHPDDLGWVRRVIQDHFDKKTPFYISEYRIRCKDGTYKWILDRGQALWDEDGNAVRMVGSHTDITERKLAEEQLHQSEERFQILARATTDVVWDWDLSTDQVWWNENVQTLFGYPPEASRNNTNWWYECIHPDDRQRIIADIHAVIDSKQQFWSNEYRFRRADGSYADIFDRGYVVLDRAGNPVRMIGAMMDISDRKRVQEELQRQNMRSRLFADITLKIRQSLQIDDILQTSVTEVQKLLGADRVVVFKLRPDGSGTVVKEAVVPSTPMILGRNIVDPCFQEDYIEKYRRGRISAIEDITQADIQPCHVEFLQGLSVKANLVVPIIMQNQLWGLLIAHQCAHPRHWDQWETELLRQLADQIGIALAQARLLEQETRQRQELSRSNEELQEFAFVASHDLQEPLRKIKTFGDRLKASCGDVLNEQGRDYLERMQNAARRMQTLIEDLLTLSRVTTRAQPFVAVDILQVTQEVLSDLEISIQQTGATIEIGELPVIDADPLQMRQLLQNLIGNALKFHRKEIQPVVKIYSKILYDSEHVSPEQCQIIVEDNGIGFNEKYLDRIFNVFQRLHGRSEYDGTGIGLAICRKIVERHQGSITAKSEPGRGAKFIVTLPIHPHS